MEPTSGPPPDKAEEEHAAPEAHINAVRSRADLPSPTPHVEAESAKDEKVPSVCERLSRLFAFGGARERTDDAANAEKRGLTRESV